MHNSKHKLPSGVDLCVRVCQVPQACRLHEQWKGQITNSARKWSTGKTEVEITQGKPQTNRFKSSVSKWTSPKALILLQISLDLWPFCHTVFLCFMNIHSVGSPKEWKIMLFKLAEFKAELVLDFKWLFQGFFCFYTQAQRGRAATEMVESISAI